MPEALNKRIVLGALLLLGAVIAALTAINIALPAGRQVDYLLQVSGAIMNLLLIVVLGGAVSFGFKSLERQKEEASKIAERQKEGQRILRSFREDFLRQFLRAYHKTKACRRNLSRHGLSVKAPQLDGLNRDQTTFYEQEMVILNDAQLEFEWLVAEATNTPDAFGHSERLLENLRIMEDYLREILREYEKNWRRLVAKPGAATLENLPELRDFTGHFGTTRYGKDFCSAKDEILRIVWRDLLPLTLLEGVPPNQGPAADAARR